MVQGVYQQKRCSRCGQLDVKYSGKVDISVDKIFLFKLFFLGFFSGSLPNIYFHILEYLSILDLLSFDKSDLQTLCYTKIYSISDTHPLALVVEWGNMPLWAIFVVGHQRIILTGVLPIIWCRRGINVSQITGNSTVCSTVPPSWHQRKTSNLFHIIGPL